MNDVQQISHVLRRIVTAGMDGEVGELAHYLHDDVVMVFPEFAGRARGKPAMLSGFEDFATHATVHEHSESDEQIDISGDTAVGSYRFDLTYSRDGGRFRSSGRDLWVFQKIGDHWLAVWRTMLDLSDQPADS